MTMKKDSKSGISRRDALKLSGLALGGAALGTLGAGSNTAVAGTAGCDPSQRNTYFNSLDTYIPGTEKLGAKEMRITFLGTTCIPRLTQACNSVFVELGNGDTFVFDCGTGVIVKYYAMRIGLQYLDRIFLTHLHADHFGDISFIYGFGPSINRRWPLYIWGPTRSGVPIPGKPDEIYEDGTADLCYHLQELNRWHNESQSFLPTAFTMDEYEPPYILDGMTCLGDGNGRNAYDIMYKELPWQEEGIAYQRNGVTITHFPAVHTRQGSLCYKLEWKGLSMIFGGDTKPNELMIERASGVDVLIHEIVVPVPVWVQEGCGVPEDSDYYDTACAGAQEVQDSSHTPQKAYGYILSQIKVPPRLAVATHFQAADDTITAALKDIRTWYPKGDVIIANDLMVINVTRQKITKRRAVVSSYTWNPDTVFSPDRTTADPKYLTPTAQLDPGGLALCIDPSIYNSK